MALLKARLNIGPRLHLWEAGWQQLLRITESKRLLSINSQSLLALALKSKAADKLTLVIIKAQS
jgi:hypothetical protein